MPNVGFLSAFPIIAAVAVVVGVGIYAYQEYMARNPFRNYEEEPQFTNPPRLHPRKIRSSSNPPRIRNSSNPPRTRKRSRNLDCTICLDSLNSLNNTRVQKLCCGHSFHQNCIEKWFNEDKNRTCPNCRRHDR